MKKIFIFFAVVLMFFYISFSACSKVEEAEPEEAKKGKIEQVTDQIAHEAVEGIQKPINKARAIQDMSEKRLKSFEGQE